MVKALSGGRVDPCGEARRQCTNLENEAKKAFPNPLRLPANPLNSFPIPHTHKTFTLASYANRAGCTPASGSSSTGGGSTVSGAMTSTCSRSGVPLNGAGVKYPARGTYRNREFCVWRIRKTHNVGVRFTNIDIENHRSCGYDYVRVSYRDAHNRAHNLKFCGTTLPNLSRVIAKAIDIVFHTDGSVVRTGFTLQVVNLAGDVLEEIQMNDEPPKEEKHPDYIFHEKSKEEEEKEEEKEKNDEKEKEDEKEKKDEKEFDYVFHDSVPEHLKDKILADEGEEKTWNEKDFHQDSPYEFHNDPLDFGDENGAAKWMAAANRKSVEVQPADQMTTK